LPSTVAEGRELVGEWARLDLVVTQQQVVNGPEGQPFPLFLGRAKPGR
jgi:hypothetical protein